MTPEATKMCEAILALYERVGPFTAMQLHEQMDCYTAARRSNLTARLGRLVNNEVVVITNAQAMSTANNVAALYAPTPAIVPYMNGDREAFLEAKTAVDQPLLCEVWGIRFPENFRVRHYPNARIYKQSWS